jgi:hypothetical protein
VGNFESEGEKEEKEGEKGGKEEGEKGDEEEEEEEDNEEEDEAEEKEEEEDINAPKKKVPGEDRADTEEETQYWRTHLADRGLKMHLCEGGGVIFFALLFSYYFFFYSVKSCMFHSVLFSRYGTQDYVAELRALVVLYEYAHRRNYLGQNADVFYATYGMMFSDYFSSLTETNRWGDGHQLYVMSQLLKRQINVYQRNRIIPIGIGQPGEPLNVAYVHSVHYNAIIPINENTLFEDITELDRIREELKAEIQAQGPECYQLVSDIIAEALVCEVHFLLFGFVWCIGTRVPRREKDCHGIRRIGSRR